MSPASSSSAQREPDRRLGVQPGRREHRHRAVLGSDEQLDLGAAEDDALDALVDQAGR
jgi:hypothetical protein